MFFLKIMKVLLKKKTQCEICLEAFLSLIIMYIYQMLPMSPGVSSSLVTKTQKYYKASFSLLKEYGHVLLFPKICTLIVAVLSFKFFPVIWHLCQRLNEDTQKQQRGFPFEEIGKIMGLWNQMKGMDLRSDLFQNLTLLRKTKIPAD